MYKTIYFAICVIEFQKILFAINNVHYAPNTKTHKQQLSQHKNMPKRKTNDHRANLNQCMNQHTYV